MTYIGLHAVHAIAARRLSAPQPCTFGTWGVTWAQYLVAEAPRILNKKPRTANADRGVLFRSLAMTYSHMGNPHTTIGDDTFHF